jgi:hypothetical protein
MNEFDRICYVARLQELFQERGQKLTEEEILRRAKRLCRKQGWSLEQAFDAMEDRLLAENPQPEDWTAE